MEPHRIKALQNQLRKTNAEMASLLGVPEMTWQSWVYGTRNPAPMYMNALLSIEKHINSTDAKAREEFFEKLASLGAIAFVAWAIYQAFSDDSAPVRPNPKPSTRRKAKKNGD